jgi:hypothetical protein
VSLKETLRGQSEHLLKCRFPLQASSLVTHGTKNSPYDHTFWRPFRVNSIPRFLSLATVFLQPLFLRFLQPLSYVFSSLYISPATTFSPALHLSGHYTSPTPTFLWPLHFLQPLYFSGHYNFFLSLATFFLWLLLFSGLFSSLATTFLWPLPFSGPFSGPFSSHYPSPAPSLLYSPSLIRFAKNQVGKHEIDDAIMYQGRTLIAASLCNVL